MRFSPHLFAFMAVLSFGAPAPASSATPKKAWITLSDAAFRQVRQLLPGITPLASGQLAGGSQTIHVLSVRESELETVAGAIHQRLQQCGGFVFHNTEAEARAALRMTADTGPSPSYAIAHRDLVEPMLAQMSDKNIEDTIVKLSAFPNRFYKSQAGATRRSGCSPNGQRWPPGDRISRSSSSRTPTIRKSLSS